MSNIFAKLGVSSRAAATAHAYERGLRWRPGGLGTHSPRWVIQPMMPAQREPSLAAMTERFDTIIIGAGQAGLATGHHLARHDRTFVILEAHDRVGDIWRDRFDSLKLYSPARYDGLPGWAVPPPGTTYPRKDQLADYLEAYAGRFELPIVTGGSVDGVRRHGDAGSCTPALIASRPTASSSPPGPSKSPYCRRSRATSTRRSASFTRTSTATRHGCAPGRSSSSVQPLRSRHRARSRRVA